MRALLTMLGIIIGIGSVIGIVTVGDSLTGSITTSMQSMGASNITVSLQQKATANTMGAQTRMFRPAPGDGGSDHRRHAGGLPRAYPAASTRSPLRSAGQRHGTGRAEVRQRFVTGVNTEGYAAANNLELLTGVHHGARIEDGKMWPW
ncbi:MAG: ABC transporter permease [Ruthenibacterium lactatiformans]